MTRTKLILLAAGGSAALLLGALAFQYLGGLAPCKLCYVQRYPHVAAVAIGLAALAIGGAWIAWAGALAAATTSAVGVYHAGVEQGWWEGPTTCTSGSVSDLSAEDLFQQIMTAPLVRCDEIPWSLFGISMAGWNAIISALLVLLWIAAARRSA